MITFKQFLNEIVRDASFIKKKPLSQRSEKEQAFLNAQKTNQPKKGKVIVHLKHEDGTVSKEAFKLTGKESNWEDEAKKTAEGHLKNMQSMHDKFPKISGSKAKDIHKVEIK